jgi:dTDP-4-dehydrorhamnose 3,5-epimerase
MLFTPQKLAGVWTLELELREDDRGFLARTYCENEFAAHSLNTRWPQCNLTLTRHKAMIRGLHYQAPPKPEIKLIRCCAGAVWDVLIDIRPDSPTRGQWQAFELTARNRLTLYVPAGVAHGFQCLTDDCELFYQMSEFYHADLARGIRWDDPALNIPWPLPNPILSDRDRNLPVWDGRL